MAGFLSPLLNRLFVGKQHAQRSPVTIGLDAELAVLKQAQGLGVMQAEGNVFDWKETYARGLSDVGATKNIAFFQQDYKTRRKELRSFSKNELIEWALDTIAEETIVYDEQNYFCYADIYRSDEISEDLAREIEDTFDRLYSCFRFNNSITAWSYVKQFLCDGYLAFEIVRDEADKKIIGFMELDPVSLKPILTEENGKTTRWWLQYEGDHVRQRTLRDEDVIYLAYSKSEEYSRVSYVERLVRSFNLFRQVQIHQIMWLIQNSTFRMKTSIPTGSKSPHAAKQSVAEFMAMMKEDMTIDAESGNLTINGQPGQQSFTNYVFPQDANGQSVEIDSIAYEGPDLNNTSLLDHLRDQFRLASKIPNSRFDREANGGALVLGDTSLDRDEISFSNFIKRIRSIFQEIMLKPLYVQLMLDHPELRDDPTFRSYLGIRYNQLNIFEELRRQESEARAINHIQTQLSILGEDEQPFFPVEYLLQKELNLSQQDLDEIEKARREAAKRRAQAEAAQGEQPTG